MFCVLWFLANFFYNLSLTATTVSSTTILSNTSSIFVFLLGFFFLRDRFTVPKLVAVLVSFSGIVMIAISDRNGSGDGEESFHGDIYALVSAFAYGCYATFLKRMIPKAREEYFPFTVFFGFVGLINIVLLLPLFPVFHYTGVEELEFPNKKTVLFLTINALLGTVVSDYCWAKSVVLLGPLITTLGMSMTIPLGMISDNFFGDVSFSVFYFIGSAAILAAFVTVTIDDYRLTKREEREEREKEQAKMQQATIEASTDPNFIH